MCLDPSLVREKQDLEKERETFKQDLEREREHKEEMMATKNEAISALKEKFDSVEALKDFKQKTAYEIGHCDWSSDVCSSDLN